MTTPRDAVATSSPAASVPEAGNTSPGDRMPYATRWTLTLLAGCALVGALAGAAVVALAQVLRRG